MSLPLRFLSAELGATERQHALPIAGLALVGDRLLTAGQDARILSFEPLPRGSRAEESLDFVRPELLCPSPFVSMQASRGDSLDKIVIAAACRDDSVVHLWEVDRDRRAQDQERERARLARAHAASSGLRAPAHPSLPPPPPAEEMLLRGHTADVRSVDVQEAFVLSASDDMTARLWDVQTGMEVLSMGHPHGVASASFVPESSLLITACADRATRAWDLRASAHRPTCVIQEPEAGGAEGGGGLAVGPGGTLASADGTGRVRLFDIPRAGARSTGWFELPTVAGSLQFVFEGRFLACAGRDGELYAVRLEDLMSQAFAVRPSHAPPGQMYPLSLLRAGRPLGTESGLSRCVLAFAFQAGGYGLGVLEETEGLALPRRPSPSAREAVAEVPDEGPEDQGEAEEAEAESEDEQVAYML